MTTQKKPKVGHTSSPMFHETGYPIPQVWESIKGEPWQKGVISMYSLIIPSLMLVGGKLGALNEMIKKQLPGNMYRCKGVIYAAENPERRAVLQVAGRRVDVALGEE